MTKDDDFAQKVLTLGDSKWNIHEKIIYRRLGLKQGVEVGSEQRTRFQRILLILRKTYGLDTNSEAPHKSGISIKSFGSKEEFKMHAVSKKWYQPRYLLKSKGMSVSLPDQIKIAELVTGTYRY